MDKDRINIINYYAKDTLFRTEFKDFLNDIHSRLPILLTSSEKQTVIDIVFDEWAKKREQSRSKISISELLKQERGKKGFSPISPECEGKKCSCCHFSATHQEYVNEYQGYRCFCSKHGAGCIQRMTRQHMKELETIQKTKERPALLWTEEEKLQRGFYCKKCYSESGKLTEIIPGTNICPKHGRI